MKIKTNKSSTGFRIKQTSFITYRDNISVSFRNLIKDNEKIKVRVFYFVLFINLILKVSKIKLEN